MSHLDRSCVIETCQKIAAPRPAVEGYQPPRLAIEDTKLPIRGAYRSYRSFSAFKFGGAPALYHPVGLAQDLVRLLRFLRTFLQAPLEVTVPRDAKARRILKPGPWTVHLCSAVRYRTLAVSSVNASSPFAKDSAIWGTWPLKCS